MRSDLQEFIRNYISEKRWSLREYCRDTERKLGQGKGISVTTLSFILRGNQRISPDVARKLAEYHGLPVTRALEMAGYYDGNGSSQEKALDELLAIRKDTEALLERLDRAILMLK